MGAAGGLGSAAVQVGKALGAHVIAGAGAAERVRLALSIGADFGINYRESNLEAEVRRITEGHGVDVAYETPGTVKHNSSSQSVETTQVAPTILELLGLDPHALKAVEIEGTPVLPGLD